MPYAPTAARPIAWRWMSPILAPCRPRSTRAPAFHVLFNNAGTNRTDRFLDVKVADFDLVLGLNVRAAFFVAQAVARKLAAAGTARLHHQRLLADGAGRGRAAQRLLRLEMGDGGR